MPSKKSVEQRDNAQSLPPFFVTKKIRKSIERLCRQNTTSDYDSTLKFMVAFGVRTMMSSIVRMDFVSVACALLVSG